MRSILFVIPSPTLLVISLIVAVLALAAGGWLLRLRQQHTCTREAMVNALVLVGGAALFLFLLRWIGYQSFQAHGPNGINVNAYGTMLMLGFLGGTYTATRLGIRRGIEGDRYIDLGLLILIGALIGARGIYVLITKDAGPFLDFKQAVSHGLGGLSFHGGLLGGLLTGGIYIRAARLPFWRLADSLVPGVALGYAVTRIGCFLNGCCYGKVTNAAWAVVFPNLHEFPPVHRHPSQLYASGIMLLAFGLLLLLSRGRSLGNAGRLTMVFLALEGVERFVMEIFREPDLHPLFNGPLTPAQVVSLLLIVAAAVGWFLLPKRAAVLDTVAPAKQMA